MSDRRLSKVDAWQQRSIKILDPCKTPVLRTPSLCFVPTLQEQVQDSFPLQILVFTAFFFRNQDLNLTNFVMAYDSSMMISAEAGWEFHKETIEQLYLSEDKTSGGDIT